jgi:hypothetical protein
MAHLTEELFPRSRKIRFIRPIRVIRVPIGIQPQIFLFYPVRLPFEKKFFKKFSAACSNPQIPAVSFL